MSVYISTGDDDPDFLCSNEGWGSVCRWVDTLDAGVYPDLVHLREHGWAEPAGEVCSQLDAATDATPPDDPNAVTTAHALLAALADLPPEAAVAVNNGIAPAG